MRGLSQYEDFAVFDTPPSSGINSFVISDANGLYYGRLTTATLAIFASKCLMQSPFNQKEKEEEKDQRWSQSLPLSL